MILLVNIQTLPRRGCFDSWKDNRASNYVIMNHKVDGIIYLSSFGCGLDSVFTHMVSRQAAKYGIPFMNLTLDEQTGEAGINTRLEAFLDMMKWRDSHKDHISSFR